MAENRNTRDDCITMNGKDIVPVRYMGDDVLHAVKMAHDGHIQANVAMPDNPLLRPGLRLGDWSQVKE